MPRYDFECKSCHHVFEEEQSYSATTLPVCPQCGKAVQKVLSIPGVVLKGGGYYSTDNRKSAAVTTTPAVTPKVEPVAACANGVCDNCPAKA